MPRTDKQIIGKQGEEISCVYLVEKGYKILDRNFRKPWGEIDIIAEKPDKTLVFVEVKTIKIGSCQGISPEDQLSTPKLQKMRKMAEFFANSNEKLIGKSSWQIDLLAIEVREEKHFNIRHYENIG